MWTSGSASASTRFLSRSVSSPTSSTSTCLPRPRATSRASLGNFENTFLIGCMRIFITASCRLRVMWSSSPTLLAKASAVACLPRRVFRRLRTSTSSPTRFIIWSRRAVSTRTVVSAAAADPLAAGRAAATGSGRAGAAGIGAGTFGEESKPCTTTGCAAPGAPLPWYRSSSFSNSSSLISPESAAAGAAAAADWPGTAAPCSWSSSASNSSSVMVSATGGGAALPVLRFAFGAGLVAATATGAGVGATGATAALARRAASRAAGAGVGSRPAATSAIIDTS